ncbi:uncharacterized protein LOC111033981 [Myzus persicae]|uniref:uncharacterized protein LOC111033981 n=1 Tax=Myzus persicae TaxID=13164 RepID=UPI000B932732|nr:uncharacterized protein LOC111033981 [Myzus persicae]
MSSICVYYLAFASLAFVVDMSIAVEYPDRALRYLAELDDATRSHWDDVMFLQKMMEVDYLWWPILYEMVKIEVPKVLYFDHYTDPDEPVDPNDLLDLEDHTDQAATTVQAAPVDPAKSDNSENEEKIVLLFALLTNLMTAKKFPGSEVKSVMKAFKSAMSCSVLKHVSLQGILHYNLEVLCLKSTQITERKMFYDWMLNMVQLSMDKLTAIDHSQDPGLPINRTRKLLAEMRKTLMAKPDPSIVHRNLFEIGSEMFDEINKTCVVPKGEDGHYSTLIADFNNDNRVEELKAHRTQLTENMREAANVKDVIIMHKNKGDINIGKNINPEGIASLDCDTLKRATGANHVQMNFLYLNLPIRTLATSQWTIISQDKLPITKPPTSTTIP